MALKHVSQSRKQQTPTSRAQVDRLECVSYATNEKRLTSPTAPLRITCDRRRLPRRILFRRRQQKLANPRALAQSLAMRRLFLIRHAKAELAVGRVDYERKLTGRGRNDAKRVAEALAVRRILPEILIHSGAARAKETAEILAATWRGKVALEEDSALYDASLTTLLDRARAIADSAQKRGSGRAQPRARRTGDGADRLRRRARTAPPGGEIPDRRGCGSGLLRPPMGGNRAPFGNADALPHTRGTGGGPRLAQVNLRPVQAAWRHLLGLT